ncbi:MAG: hypothetical protein IPN26_05325 [Bacteroidetes bacterium]|nr:hypothetical protein [Bacteroidota bacterium]
MNLTINNSTNNTTTETACDSYIWSVNGMTYASSGFILTTQQMAADVLIQRL